MQPRRRIAVAGLALSLLLAFSAFRPPSTPGPLERDFEAYYAAGVTLNGGGDPYGRAIWPAEQRIPGVDATRDELLPFVGPAATLPLWALLGRLPYRIALAAWTAILVAALGTIVAAALRLAHAPRDLAVYALALALAVASAPMIGTLALGQAALVSAASIAAALTAYRARWRLGAFCTTLFAAVQPNLAFALIARMRSCWDIAAGGAAAGAFAALTLLAGGGIAGFVAYVQRLGAHAQAERDIAIQHTPAAIFYALGLTPQTASTVGTIIALSAATATAIVIVRERLDATTATLLAGAMLPLAVPFFHEPDFVIELLPILILALRSSGRVRGLAAVAASLVLVDWLGFAQRHGAQGQILCLGFAVAFAFVGVGGPNARRWARADIVGFAALGMLAAIATPLAITHPAPTWPDMLPPHFRATAELDASAVWGLEQRTSGLAIREPVWGFLRALPLVGCIILGAALVEDARGRRRRERTDSDPAVRQPCLQSVRTGALYDELANTRSLRLEET